MAAPKNPYVLLAKVGAVVLGLGAIGYGIYKLTGAAADKKKARKEEYPRDETKDSNIDEAAASRIAETVYTAMAGWGTNEEVIFAQFLQPNAAAIKLIYNAFGSKDGENMYQWFIGDLDQEDLQILRELWRSKGIVPEF